ncbi:unnamed protein product, partial [Ectocarpus sp. 12 AP-2014]
PLLSISTPPTALLLTPSVPSTPPPTTTPPTPGLSWGVNSFTGGTPRRFDGDGGGDGRGPPPLLANASTLWIVAPQATDSTRATPMRALWGGVPPRTAEHRYSNT